MRESRGIAPSCSMFLSLCCAAWLACVLAGCALLPTTPEEPATAIATQTDDANAATENTRAPTLAPPPTVAPVDTPAPVRAAPTSPAPLAIPLTPQSIYQRVAPSVAFVDTATGTGSAVLVREGYLLTNGHVVWPFEAVRVVFPDGTAFDEAPVVAYDLIADLAIVGPLDVSLPPVALVGRENLPIGSPVYTIGYPGEVEEYPQPTMAQGILARLRQWETLNLTYLQSDTAAIGGQSGGVLLSSQGEVIGITGLRFEDEFSLALSADDIGERVEALLAGKSAEVGLRPLPTTGGETAHTFTLDAIGPGRDFLLDAAPDEYVEIEVWGDGDAYFIVTSPDGYVEMMEDEYIDESEEGSFVVPDEAPLLVQVGHESNSSESYTIECSHPLLPLVDPDDGASFWLDTPYWGAIDHAFDTDVLRLPVVKGERVVIHVSSILADPEIDVVLAGTVEPLYETDDDSGGGVYGTDSLLVYEPPDDGTLLIAVSDATQQGMGGYRVLVMREE